MEEEQELNKSVRISKLDAKIGNYEFDPNDELLNKDQKISYIIPFMIHYSDAVINIDGPYNVEETFLNDYTGEGESPILFNNRKDANRMISLLKYEVAKKEFVGMKNKHIKPEEVDDYENMVKLYDEAIENIIPRQLYR